MDIGSLLLGGGSLLSGIGGLVGGNSRGRDIRRIQQAEKWEDNANMMNLEMLLYGPGRTRLNSLLTQAAGDVVAQRATWAEVMQRPEIRAAMEEYNRTTGGPIIQQQRDLADRFIQQDQGLLRDLQRDQSGLAARDAQMEQLAQLSGVGRERAIRQDSQRDLSNANAQAQAMMAARGLGNSTLLANQFAGNADRMARTRDRSLNDLNDSTLRMRMQTMDNNAGRAQNRLNQLLGFRNLITERRQNLRMLPINTQLNSQMSGIMNPTTGNQQSSGGGGMGSALGSIGNAGAQLGSMLLMQNMLAQPGNSGSYNGGFMQPSRNISPNNDRFPYGG